MVWPITGANLTWAKPASQRGKAFENVESGGTRPMPATHSIVMQHTPSITPVTWKR
jgi:hypothetical protein